MPERSCGVHAVGMSLAQRSKIKEANGDWCGQKRLRPPFVCLWTCTALKLKRSFPPRLHSTGQKEFGLWKMELRAKEKRG